MELHDTTTEYVRSCGYCLTSPKLRPIREQTGAGGCYTKELGLTPGGLTPGGFALLLRHRALAGSLLGLCQRTAGAGREAPLLWLRTRRRQTRRRHGTGWCRRWSPGGGAGRTVHRGALLPDL